MLKMKIRKSYLGKEFIFLCIASFLISTMFSLVGMTLVVKLISQYYNTESKIEKLEHKYIQELQKYVEKNNVSVYNIQEIDDWVEQKDDVYLKVFFQGNILYDTIYGVTDYKGVPDETEKEYQELELYNLKLQNKEVKIAIFCYDFRVEGYAKIIVLLIAFMLFSGIMFWGIRKKIYYLYKITFELKQVAKNLDIPITIEGADEITEVANGINHLRSIVLEKLENEKKAYNSNIRLVTELSHDIKTPLTAIISYIELAGYNIDDKEEIKRCLDISLDKAIHLKNLVNELFDHFLLHSNEQQVVFEKVNTNELIVQMVEENLFELETRGVSIKRSISDISSELRVNVILVHRLFDNLFSNLIKYADLSKDIYVQYYLENSYLIISVKNYKKWGKNNQFSTKIGLNNCRAIMEKHNGQLILFDYDNIFEIKLYFPVE